MSVTACGPKCGCSGGVTWKGRKGGEGPSKDLWNCSRDGDFQTPART